MKRVLLLCLLSLLAVTSSASGPRYVGTWVYGTAGDNLRILKLKVRTNQNVGWGSAMGTCYTPYLEVRKSGADSLYATLTGSWADSTEADALFSVGAASVLAPASGFQDYECYLKLVKGASIGYIGSDDDAGLFLFRIQRWPK